MNVRMEISNQAMGAQMSAWLKKGILVPKIQANVNQFAEMELQLELKSVILVLMNIALPDVNLIETQISTERFNFQIVPSNWPHLFRQ